MDALSGGGNGFWGMLPFHSHHRIRGKRRPTRRTSKPSSDLLEPARPHAFQFPLKQALIAGSLALTGDTMAQLRHRWVNHNKQHPSSDTRDVKEVMQILLSKHDCLRALRMASYGFLLYGPGSYAWYQYLDQCMPKQTVKNLLMKVLLNQIVVGPSVIAVVFAWNNLWLGKLSELPSKYQKDAIPTLFFGFRFWIPVTVLNFWVIPLQARVAFMSMGSVFWNFCLSSTLSK